MLAQRRVLGTKAHVGRKFEFVVASSAKFKDLFVKIVEPSSGWV